MTKFTPAEIQFIVESGVFGRNNSVARQMRNEVQADWMQEVFNRLYVGQDSVEDARPASTAGIGHTVESMVEELRRRVGLDAIEKTASGPAGIPLFKAAQEVDEKKNLRDIADYLTTYHIKPSHAFKENEALFFEVKEKFGIETVQQIGRDKIMKLIEKLREELSEPNLAEGLPKYDGSPTPAKSDSDEDNEVGTKPVQR